MTYPQKITIKSDGNVLEFSKVIDAARNNPLKIEYVYTKSKTKKGDKIHFTEEQLAQFLKNQL